MIGTRFFAPDHSRWVSIVHLNSHSMHERLANVNHKPFMKFDDFSSKSLLSGLSHHPYKLPVFASKFYVEFHSPREDQASYERALSKPKSCGILARPIVLPKTPPVFGTSF